MDNHRHKEATRTCPACGHCVTGFEQQQFDIDRAREAAVEAGLTRLRAALDRIAFCGAGEDYRVLREIARKALTS